MFGEAALVTATLAEEGPGKGPAKTRPRSLSILPATEMLRTFLLVEASVPVKKKRFPSATAMGNPKLQRVASAPYSIQVKRMQEVHRTLSESGGSTYRSFDSATEAPAGQDSVVVKRKSSLKVRLCDDTGGELRKQSSGRKSVTWRDLEVPGRSISEFHLITPRSCISDRHSHQGGYRYGGGGSGCVATTAAQEVISQSRSQGHISLHTNQQLQYYYYHQRASRR